MAHVQVPAGLPGILGPMAAFPHTANPLNEMAEFLLAKETPTFSKAERETVASYVSFLNNCQFCSESHAAVADVHWKKPGMAKMVWESPEQAPVSLRFRALLAIASKVQKDGRSVSTGDVQKARDLGATERDVHDAVLISAAFCMYNRYVDGLATMAPPRGDAAYEKIGQRLATVGYKA